MFGIDDVLFASLLGGGLGALTGKKPIQGALMGAGLGAAGGAFLPGLLGSGGAAAGEALPTGAFLGEGATSGVPAWDSAAGGGLLGHLKTAGAYAKPIGQAAQAAGAVGGLFGGQQQPIMPSPMQQPQPGANQTLASIAQMPSMGTQQMQEAEQMRQRRRMGLLGGGYGSA